MEGEQDVRYLVMGDSRVRPFRRNSCGKVDRCVMKPGAKMADIDNFVQEEIDRCAPDAVIVQVGVNEVGPRRSEVMADLRSLLWMLQEARSPAIVTGILPSSTSKKVGLGAFYRAGNLPKYQQRETNMAICEEILKYFRTQALLLEISICGTMREQQRTLNNVGCSGSYLKRSFMQ